MIYPLMEYAGLIYIFLDFVSDMLANMRGDLAPWVWTFSRILFPINLFLMSQFRKSIGAASHTHNLNVGVSNTLLSCLTSYQV